VSEQAGNALAPDELAEISRLLEAAATAHNHAPLAEDRWLRLKAGDKGVRYLLDRTGPGSSLVGYAQLTAERARPGAWALDIVTDPRARDGGEASRSALLHIALGEVGDGGGGSVEWWVAKPDRSHDELAEAAGLAPGREVVQMRRTLGGTGNSGVNGEAIPTRPFRPGADEEAWLAVNNRAFAGHPDQGEWTLADIRAREHQLWFDPGGFLLHEHDGRLAAFCWTKVQFAGDRPVGEIYVIAVDPDFQGAGLGKGIAVAGLRYLASRGITLATLYVDSSNTAARRLYERLGFTVDHIDRAYTGTVR
jgi:mycothiol synthase